MSVEPFDPGALKLRLDAAVLEELIAAATSLDVDGFGLSRERITALAAVARHDGQIDWRAAAAEIDVDALVALIRLYTLAEILPGWESGAKSPVIPLAAELKKRGAYPDDLTAWIKSNTENRFLPYGSLMDRL
ncbi:MAG: hypothetical protein AAGE43_06310 [Pseudomonadota bacterium]